MWITLKLLVEKMPELKIKCPHCGEITGTRISLGEGAKFVPENYRRNQSKCQHCGRMITWDGEDVVNKEEFE